MPGLRFLPTVIDNATSAARLVAEERHRTQDEAFGGPIAFPFGVKK